MGILFYHALRVLELKNIQHISKHYILKRWTRDANVRSTEGTQKNKGIDPKEELTRRYRDMCHFAVQLGQELQKNPRVMNMLYQVFFSCLRV